MDRAVSKVNEESNSTLFFIKSGLTRISINAAFCTPTPAALATAPSTNHHSTSSLFNVEIEAGLSAAARTFIGKFGRPIADHAWLDLGAVLTGSSAALKRGPFVHPHAGHVHVCLHFDIANIDKLIFSIAKFGLFERTHEGFLRHAKDSHIHPCVSPFVHFVSPLGFPAISS
jgi:hypothetical protein